ncbi:MAG: HEPN domain-containing protein [Candidatus Nanohaloarchaea archaeon]|nr:HEPN domain-containing protein [Candidatus Nanohaloarchaea archaeon]
MDERLDWADEKIEAARTLCEAGFYADAISRAYYGMYHAAKALLESEDITAKTHAGLIRMIGKEFVASGRIADSLGKALTLAEEEREEADYEIAPEFSEEEAEQRIEDAETFIEKARDLLAS